MHRYFPGRYDQIGAIRAAVRAALPVWCPAREDTVLIVDEIATNAIRHSDSGRPGGAIALAVAHEVDAVRGHVRDAGTEDETPRAGTDPDTLCESGRGLFLVDALAKEWGTFRDGVGRVVWFEVAEPGCRVHVTALP